MTGTPDVHPCLPGERADRARENGFGAVVAVDVDAPARTLRVLLLGQAPDPLPGAGCVRVEGPGRAVRVVSVRVEGSPPPTRRATLLVTVDRLGDRSPYTLRLVDPDRPGAPFPGFDPRHSRAEFTFTADCAEEADCAPEADRPAPAGPVPALDHLAKDYASFRRLILDRLSLVSPAWADREVPDLGVTLVELLAHVGDRLSYRQDAVATEAYLHTARLRTSVRRHLRLVDHRLHEGCNARTWVHLAAEEPAVLRADTYWFATALPDAGPLVSAARLRGSTAHFERYEPVVAADLVLRPAHNGIRLWTWDGEECCLPAGTTSATLVDPGTGSKRALELAPGDVLVLEEVRGPVTGVPGDADPRHRQAVRLTETEEITDPVHGQRLLRVAWAEEDALAFPLVLATVGGEGCCLFEDVGVAHGNIVLVDHGSSGTPPLRLTAPATATRPAGCDGPGRPRQPAEVPLRWLPRLDAGPLTRRSPHPDPARTATAQVRALEAIPARAAEAVADLYRRAGDPLTDADLALARTLWGARAVADAGLETARDAARRRAALALLRSRSAALLARRTARLARLAARARSGTPLDTDTAAEVAASWGAALAAGLDPDDPRAAGPASAALTQDPRAALPQLTLTSAAEHWEVRADLLDSGGDDPHVVVEDEDDGTARLRFGDGRLGRAVTGGQAFSAAVRVGNGPAGNAGSDTVVHVVVCAPTDARITAVRNPLPATGGIAPELVADARLFGPTQYRHRLERAVTADDYSALAGEVAGVQRAATDLAWNGSWYEADVAVDALGRADAPAALLEAVRDRLERGRRIGHDLRVDAPRTVAVDVGLRLCLAPDARRAAVERAVRARLGNGIGGLFHPDRLTFDSDLHAGRLVAEAMAVPGVVAASVERLGRAETAVPLVPDGGVLAFGPLEIPAGGADPAGPGAGVLRIDLAGGR
ncbi:putative baseplate assembly protein [Streptomyces sp. NBC_01451]|uniref:putative baseplate assembly protein n=1 Tax=Streptomyces sp. NBC_01451 TaxID=2903872 RepID=UPI002E302C3E|nr:putative baseplate assembly protein [Streptomyces sp. NBC_01451]